MTGGWIHGGADDSIEGGESFSDMVDEEEDAVDGKEGRKEEERRSTWFEFSSREMKNVERLSRRSRDAYRLTFPYQTILQIAIASPATSTGRVRIRGRRFFAFVLV